MQKEHLTKSNMRSRWNSQQMRQRWTSSADKNPTASTALNVEKPGASGWAWARSGAHTTPVDTVPRVLATMTDKRETKQSVYRRCGGLCRKSPRDHSNSSNCPCHPASCWQWAIRVHIPSIEPHTWAPKHETIQYKPGKNTHRIHMTAPQTLTKKSKIFLPWLKFQQVIFLIPKCFWKGKNPDQPTAKGK